MNETVNKGHPGKQAVLAEATATITELRKNPMETIARADGMPVAILSRNEPVFYCVPAEAWQRMVDRMEQVYLDGIADEHEQ